MILTGIGEELQIRHGRAQRCQDDPIINGFAFWAIIIVPTRILNNIVVVDVVVLLNIVPGSTIIRPSGLNIKMAGGRRRHDNSRQVLNEKQTNEATNNAFRLLFWQGTFLFVSGRVPVLYVFLIGLK